MVPGILVMLMHAATTSTVAAEGERLRAIEVCCLPADCIPGMPEPRAEPSFLAVCELPDMFCFDSMLMESGIRTPFFFKMRVEHGSRDRVDGQTVLGNR